MSQDDIANQQDLLAAHRRTLAIYLRQLASLGADHAPPGVHNGIVEARAEIQRIKTWLHSAGIEIEDLPGDEAIPDEYAPSLPIPGVRSDSYTVGDIHDVQGVAIGPGATATVHIHQQSINQRIPLMAPPKPVHFIDRPAEYDQLLGLLTRSERGSQIAITAALRGAGGFGKTTLALAICQDPRVRAAFPDGILWVTVGERPSTLTSKLIPLIEALTGSRPQVSSLDMAIRLFDEALGKRNCLLVIDDVWKAAHLEPFIQGGVCCTRLITTRISDVLPIQTAQIKVDSMQQMEAVQLLCVGLTIIEPLQPKLEALARRLGDWPILLRLVNGALYERTYQGATLSSALAEVEQLLDLRGLTAFDAAVASERRQAAALTIEISIATLPDNLRLRHAELAIFAQDSTISIETIATLWQATAGLQRLETIEVCLRLERLSLLQEYNQQQHTVRLHDVVHDYLTHKHEDEFPHWHALMLSHARSSVLEDRGPVVARSWATLPDNETYLWHNLGYHLEQARKVDELVSTIKDLRYLTRKAVLFGLLYVEDDLRRALRCAPSDEQLQLLAQRIRLSTHVFNACSGFDEFGTVLLSRLSHFPSLIPLCATLKLALKRPLIVPIHRLPETRDPALLRTFQGHDGAVRSCTFSPDGARILSVSEDTTLKLWDLASGQLLQTFTAHIAPTTDCAFNSEGTRILSASLDGTIKLWDVSSNQLLHTFTGHKGPVRACAFSPNGELVLSASDDRTIRVWDVESHQALRIYTGHVASVKYCVFSDDGKRILSASEDTTLKLWDVDTGNILKEYQGHEEGVVSCKFSPDEKLVLSASRDKTLRLWNTDTGQVVQTLKGHIGAILNCAFSPDGTTVLSASEDTTLKLWDVFNRQVLQTFQGHTAPVASCEFSIDGTHILTGSWDRTLRLWDVMSGLAAQILTGHTETVTSCTFSPDGTRILSASDDSTLKIWDVKTGTLLQTFRGHTQAVKHCAFSPAGDYILSVSEDRTIRLWDVATGHTQQIFKGHGQAVRCCLFSPNGEFFLSASGDKTLKLSSVATGEVLRSFQGHKWSIRSCTFSPDGAYILSASADATLIMWDITTGRILQTFRGHLGTVEHCAFSPDGTCILSASEDTTLKLWDVASGRVLQTLRGHDQSVTHCAFSPDGRLILSASEDTSLKLWDVFTGQLLQTLHVHKATVTHCAFSPDGTHVLSASADKTLKLWKITSQLFTQAIQGHKQFVSSCAFNPNGTRVATTSIDGTLKMWDVASGQVLDNLLQDTNWITNCAFSPDGLYLLSASGPSTRILSPFGIEARMLISYDVWTLTLWSGVNGQLIGNFAEHEGLVRDSVFSSDGTRVLSASTDGTLRLWEAATGKVLRTFRGHSGPVRSCAFSPDGTFLLSGSEDGTVKLWDVVDGQVVQTLQGHKDWVLSCAFSPDGKYILSASEDKTLKLWNVDELIPSTSIQHKGWRSLLIRSWRRIPQRKVIEPLVTFEGHIGPIDSAVFSPDGTRILSAAGDGTVRLWDTVNKQCLTVFRADVAFTSCAMASDGRTIVVGGNHGEVYFLQIIDDGVT